MQEETGVPQAENVLWLVYRIPTSVNSLSEAVPQGEFIENRVGTPLQGKNSQGVLGYSGPLPPLFDPPHPYVFKLYALESPLKDLRPGMTKDEVYKVMKDHILEETVLRVTYQRQRPQKKRAA
jgi:Raf kinase inhibitor-like YbhB/YbcL family protein